MPKKYTYDEVRGYIENEGYTLVDTEYIGSRIKLTIVCPLGHEFKKSFHHFKYREQRCPICGGYKKYTAEELKEICKQRGFELLETTYNNHQTKVLVKCVAAGHESNKLLGNLINGAGCRYCKCRGKKLMSEVVDYATKYNYKILSTEYIGKEEKLLFMCPKGHKFKMPWNNFRNGQRCSICRTSRGENVVRFILEKILPDEVTCVEQKRFYFNDRKNYYIYDFYISLDNIKIFLEFDGLQHFMFKSHFHKDMVDFERKLKRDLDKDEFANKNGKIIRVNYRMTNDEISDFIILELSKYLKLKTYKLNTLDAEFYLKNTYTIQEMAQYYLNNSLEETIQKFSVSNGTIFKEFKNIYNMSKTKYLNKINS